MEDLWRQFHGGQTTQVAFNGGPVVMVNESDPDELIGEGDPVGITIKAGRNFHRCTPEEDF